MFSSVDFFSLWRIPHPSLNARGYTATEGSEEESPRISLGESGEGERERERERPVALKPQGPNGVLSFPLSLSLSLSFPRLRIPPAPVATLEQLKAALVQTRTLRIFSRDSCLTKNALVLNIYLFVLQCGYF